MTSTTTAPATSSATPTTAGAPGAVLTVPPAAPAEAAAHFAARLRFETDVSDVHADLASGAPGIVLVDSRSEASWAQGRIPGALHIPTARIAELAPQLVDPALTVVTYCWGPGCNGATRAALAFAQLGYRVKEMLGGFEYWAREGFDTVAGTTTVHHTVDPLTAPDSGISCAC